MDEPRAHYLYGICCCAQPAKDAQSLFWATKMDVMRGATRVLQRRVRHVFSGGFRGACYDLSQKIVFVCPGEKQT